jgi:hypothetical protein
MGKASSTFPLRWLLLAAQLVLCGLAMWPFRVELIGSLIEVNMANRPAQTKVVKPPEPDAPVQNININLSPMTEAERRADEINRQIRWIPDALNIPSLLVYMPYEIWGPTHEEWSPNGMSRDAWETLTYPIIGIMFWWIAGRSLEALSAARRRELVPSITWIEVVIGSLAFLLAALSCIAFLTSRSEPLPRPWQVMSIGGAIWTILGASTITARIVQWRIRRRIARNAASV